MSLILMSYFRWKKESEETAFNLVFEVRELGF